MFFRLLRLVLVGGVALALLAAKSKTLTADEILRRAEEIRSPDISYAADFTIRVVSTSGKVPTHEAAYSMVARGKDHTIVLMRAPKALYGGLLLIADDKYWMLLPRAATPLQLAPVQILQGDVATGDVARANLARSFTPTLAGEELVDDKPCYRLELADSRGPAPYTRVVFWVAKDGFFPEKLEYYGQTERLLRTVRYYDYVKGPLGRRAMRIEIESPQQMENRSTLTFSNLRKAELAGVDFTSTGLAPLRDAAIERAESSGSVTLFEELLAILRRQGRLAPSG